MAIPADGQTEVKSNMEGLSKNQTENRALPILLISSRGRDKHRSEAEKAGVDRYLVKPWNEQLLLETVTDMLAGR